LKKYTLQVEALDDSVTVNEIRIAIEDILLHLQPRITYRLGLVSNISSNSFLAEIASDGKKELLDAYLRTIQDKLPVRVGQFGWGWIAKEAIDYSINHAPQQPEVVDTRSFLPNTNVFPLRYILSISLMFVLILFLIIRFYLDQLLFLDNAYQILFILWLILLIEIPLDIRLYVKKINCELTELVVMYSFKKKTIRMSWETIDGLERRDTIYIIYRRNDSPLRFYINNGFKEKHAMLTTITQKASLNEVETGVSKAVYKRYEAS
jgi:hypothetical protein